LKPLGSAATLSSAHLFRWRTPMNDDDYDPLNETDPEVRSLRAELRRQAAELVRLQAKLDQIDAATEEQHREMERLFQLVKDLEARYRRTSRLIWRRAISAAVVGSVVGQILAMWLF